VTPPTRLRVRMGRVDGLLSTELKALSLERRPSPEMAIKRARPCLTRSPSIKADLSVLDGTITYRVSTGRTPPPSPPLPCLQQASQRAKARRRGESRRKSFSSRESFSDALGLVACGQSLLIGPIGRADYSTPAASRTAMPLFSCRLTIAASAAADDTSCDAMSRDHSGGAST